MLPILVPTLVCWVKFPSLVLWAFHRTGWRQELLILSIILFFFLISYFLQISLRISYSNFTTSEKKKKKQFCKKKVPWWAREQPRLGSQRDIGAVHQSSWLLSPVPVCLSCKPNFTNFNFILFLIGFFYFQEFFCLGRCPFVLRSGHALQMEWWASRRSPCCRFAVTITFFK